MLYYMIECTHFTYSSQFWLMYEMKSAGYAPGWVIIFRLLESLNTTDKELRLG